MGMVVMSLDEAREVLVGRGKGCNGGYDIGRLRWGGGRWRGWEIQRGEDSRVRSGMGKVFGKVLWGSGLAWGKGDGNW
ncbi:hypothetical protein Ancab_028729 [Ancistrocladus abbreviatus]